MLVLGIDTSTEVAAIGLIKGQQILGEINIALYRRHSERLLPNIKSLFDNIDYDLHDVDGLAVGLGPGSFTGLRIGLSVIKGFGQILQVPVIGLSTLDIISWSMQGYKGWLVPAMDARHERIYTALYDFRDKPLCLSKERKNFDLDKKKVLKDQPLSLKKLLDRLNKIDSEGCYFFAGNGVNKYRDILNETNLKIISSLTNNYLRGSVVAELGAYYLQQGQNDDLSQLVPNYLKKPQAEINFKKIGSE